MNNEFLLERYKYILEQKKELNKTTFKVAGIFQAALLAIVGCEFTVVNNVLSRSLSPRPAETASLVLLVSSLIVASFCCLSIIGGLGSWLKYRRDEGEIERIIHGASRAAPQWKDLLRWYETYVLLAMVISEVVLVIAVLLIAIPMLKTFK